MIRIECVATGVLSYWPDREKSTDRKDPFTLGRTVVDDDFRNLGQRLQALRRGHGLTLELLAKDSGLSAGYLSQIENGQAVPSLTALQVIAASLGVGVATFSRGRRRPRVVRAADRHAFRLEPQSGEEYACWRSR
jgi:transcriptional regulator with XRE-family HTH domain